MEPCVFCDSTEYSIELRWVYYKTSLYKSPMIFQRCTSCGEDTANSYCLNYNAVHRSCLREYTRKVESENQKIIMDM